MLLKQSKYKLVLLERHGKSRKLLLDEIDCYIKKAGCVEMTSAGDCLLSD